MTDRPPMPQETVATRAAFRVGVKGTRYTENPDPDFDIPVATDNTPGPNERHFETIERLPGLSFALRGERQPWGAEDTAFVFRETFKAPPTDAQKAYDAILGYAQAADRQSEIAGDRSVQSAQPSLSATGSRRRGEAPLKSVAGSATRQQSLAFRFHQRRVQCNDPPSMDRVVHHVGQDHRCSPA